jgi:hypothetical protein
LKLILVKFIFHIKDKKHKKEKCNEQK